MSAQTIITTATPFVVGLLGVFYGQKIYKGQRRFNFIERQLNELYSPILGIIKEIQAKSNVRETINIKANETWKELIKEWNEAGMQTEKPNFKPFEEILNYNNQQLKEELIPKYKKIITFLTDNYSLADEETTKWYYLLCEFTEIWERSLNDSLPNDLIKKLDHREEKQEEFYKHIEDCVLFFKNQLKPNKFWKRLF